MIVVINSECSGKSRLNSQRILDEFLPRIGRRCWSGRITEQGLNRLKSTLAKKATTSSSICCQRVSGNKRLEVLWFLGNRKKFDTRGNCSVSETSRNLTAERSVSASETLLRASTELAALFHDLGKSTQWFSDKLKAGKPLADPARHELISYIVMRAMLKLCENDEVKWLQALADRTKVKEFMHSSFIYGFENAHELCIFDIKNNMIPDLSSAIHQATRGSRHVGIDFYPDRKTPKFSIVSLLVLTHHRLPDGYFDNQGVHRMSLKNMSAFWESNSPKEVKFDDAVKKMLSLPAKKAYIWEDDKFLDNISFVAQRLLEAKPSDNFDLDVRTASIYGRTALILGDHKASQIGNTKYPLSDQKPDPKQIYANTNRNKGNALAETLSSHLNRVCKETATGLENLFVTRHEFPVVDIDYLPESIRSPRPAEGTPFNWQYLASKKTKTSFKDAPNGAGFFGVLMAGTGSGKTRMAPLLMSALSPMGLRFNMCTGMRSLTLQGGKEYQEDMRFNPEDVSVIIGDQLTKELFDLERSQTLGTDAEEFDEEIVVSPNGTITDHILPKSTARLINVDPTCANSALLAAPILISTIDTLMSVADATRGRHAVKTLRVASADLVIDEIDDYGNEDLVAISRLVYLAGSFGRKVIISSATTSPEICFPLFKAYKEGWAVHCHSSGANYPIVSGWYSELCEPKCEIVDDIDRFKDSHIEFVTSKIDALVFKPKIRKAKVLRVDNPENADDYFAKINAEIIDMHHHHHISDDKTEKKLSVGVIRWSNVATSILHSKYVLSCQLPDEYEILVVPYNGTLLPAVRFLIEKSMNKMLRRKIKNGRDPILNDPYIRQALDNAVAKNVIVVFVTTSIEEVGRDHDFDFAIVEPGSYRGLVQIAGRVRRHRNNPVEQPNIAIIESCFKEIRSRWGDAFKTRNGFFSYPGIETPVQLLPNTQKPKDFDDLTRLASHSAFDIYDIDNLRQGLDASDAISMNPSSNSALALKERELTRCYLDDGLVAAEKLSVEDFCRDPMATLTRHHPLHRRFRRTHAIDVSYTLTEDGNWHVLDSNHNTEPSNHLNSRIEEIDISTERLLIQINSITDLTHELAQELWSEEEEIARWKRNSLTTISRPIRAGYGNIQEITKKINSTKFVFNFTLGMTEKNKWLEKLL